VSDSIFSYLLGGNALRRQFVSGDCQNRSGQVEDLADPGLDLPLGVLPPSWVGSGGATGERSSCCAHRETKTAGRMEKKTGAHV
jgi:hypothetical protein